VAGVLLAAAISGCNKSRASADNAGAASTAAAQTQAGDPPPDDAPPPDSTGGFDGHRAWQLVAKQVSFGPRPSGSPAIQQLQAYLKSELTGYGCKFDVDDFQVDTPVGHRAMENILVKIPGDKPGIILLGTHYDTKILPNFVGADDAGSSTAVMLEIARNLCRTHGRHDVWIAFFDGEEATRLQWTDEDSVYGSREMAARLSISGDLPRVKAFLLADLVGGKKLHFKRDGASTPALVDAVWRVADKLGYGNIFVNEVTDIGGDDHFPFMKRSVPSVDVIDLDTAHDVPYWHDQHGTDTLDKISAKSLAITGHVFLESVKDLQSK
jgi:glutaminyl-peptide cyclotransferase